MTRTTHKTEVERIRASFLAARDDSAHPLHAAWRRLVTAYENDNDSPDRWTRGHVMGAIEMFVAYTDFNQLALLDFLDKLIRDGDA
jgi:hypothetical protein